LILGYSSKPYRLAFFVNVVSRSRARDVLVLTSVSPLHSTFHLFRLSWFAGCTNGHVSISGQIAALNHSDQRWITSLSYCKQQLLRDL